MDAPDTDAMEISGKEKAKLVSKVSAGHFATTVRKDHVELTSPFKKDGLIENWDLFENLLNHTFNRELRLETKEHAIMFAEPNHNARKARERITELLFEKFDAPAMHLTKSAVLSAYANGRVNAVVLDVGHSGTSAVPVEDGRIGRGKFIRTDIGGRAVNDRFMQTLTNMNVPLMPLWSYKRTIIGKDGVDDDNMIRRSKLQHLSFPNTAQSFVNFSRIRLVEELKAALCVCNENPTVQLRALPIVLGSYELPDGNTVEMGEERFAVAEETLFAMLPHISTTSNTETSLSYVNQYLNGARNRSGTNQQTQASNGLHGLVIDAIKLCDPNVHRDMYAGVCLTGGTSDMGGLYERLSYGLLETYHKVRVLAATGSHERKYCAWTGGSILATFSEFQNLWVSKQEFFEVGPSIVHRKCL